MNNTKTALITGASSGFGEAIARKLAFNGYKLILTARRHERLRQLSEELEFTYDIQTQLFPFDVRRKDQVMEAANFCKSLGTKIDVIINNAGLALGLSGIADGDPDDWDNMLDTNVKGLLYVTKYFIQLMPNGGHIVNIGSIAGKEVYANGNVYCASKHAVDALNQAMRIDLLQKEIKVSQIAPGMADTEFSLVRFNGDSEKAKSVYKNLNPLLAEDIADAVEFVLSRPAHVCINDMVIMPTAQANASTVYRKP